MKHSLTIRNVIQAYSELLEVHEDLINSETGKWLWSKDKRDGVNREIMRGRKLINRATK